MSDGYQALTAKEKEALRLLLNGHDAKSMARLLGLSVHTVNERLRDARRKLGVTSSREAARLLRDREGTAFESPPELLGDKGFGDAARSGSAQVFHQPARGSGTRRRTGWIVGGIAMTLGLALYALSALSGPGQLPVASPAPSAAVAPTPASEAAAVDAARAFLALLDRDDWTASWQTTHKSFQLLNTVEWWTRISQQVRGEVGTAESRELATVEFAAAPPHGYWTVTFKARYSKKGNATETVSLAWEDGAWKVASVSVE